MSSSRRPERRRAFPPSSLRGKLIAQVIALLAVVCLVVGLVTEVALRSFLIHQLDDRLSAASDRGGRAPPPGTPSFPAGQHAPDSLRVPGQGIGTLSVLIQPTGAVRDGVLGGPGAPSTDNPFPSRPVPADDLKTLVGLPTDAKKRSVDLGSLGEYRVVAVRSPDGNVLITGLPLSDVTATLWQLGLIFGAVALGGLLLAGGVGAVTIRRTMLPLDRLARTASHVSELRLDRGEVALYVRVPEVDTDARTEVGKVGAAFNRMLGHVSAALTARHDSESRVRQFVADASHELRTPLAAIRGYAELTRRAKGQVPPEIAHAMNRVESEAARMTTLVDDLLLLARLDAGRPLELAEVDLRRLVADAVGDAHIAGRRHRWRLELPDEPVIVSGDAQRLHQVLANLLANGRTHTPPGTMVTTRLAVSAEAGAVLTVTDNGPGIAPELLPNVFERFARGDSSRSRSAGSTGLGMAIAGAVVHAHHGTIGVHSRPGRTEFEVRLPRTAVAPQRHDNATLARTQ